MPNKPEPAMSPHPVRIRLEPFAIELELPGGASLIPALSAQGV
jgi:hypothetical protein